MEVSPFSKPATVVHLSLSWVFSMWLFLTQFLVLVQLPMWDIKTKQLHTAVCPHTPAEMLHAASVCVLVPFILAWISKEFGKSASRSDAGGEKIRHDCQACWVFVFVCLPVSTIRDVLDSQSHLPLSFTFFTSLDFSVSCLFPPLFGFASSNAVCSVSLRSQVLPHQIISLLHMDATLAPVSFSFFFFFVCIWKVFVFLALYLSFKGAYRHFVKTALWCWKRRWR